jgi:hypothetical protein
LVAQTEAPPPLAEQSTVEGYFRAFSSLPWDELLMWPPDVFCLCNLVLDHTECYRFVVAPPPGRSWPPTDEWNDDVCAAAREWAAGRPPAFVRRHWDALANARSVPLAAIRAGDAWAACEALLTLHAVADQACAGMSAPFPPADDALVARAAVMLDEHGSLSRLSPTRVRVVPKTNFAAQGITIRSLSRYLALFYESVDVRWKRVNLPLAGAPRQDYNIVLLPWPLRVQAEDFHQVPSPLAHMDSDRFGFFEFSPDSSLDVGRASALLEKARENCGPVDAVVLPEGAVQQHEIDLLEDLLDEQRVTFLVAGVRRHREGAVFGRNYLHFAVRTASGWERYQQDKHHRWCLDERQLRQYHLTHRLSPAKRWWEAIDIPPRAVHVVDVGGRATAAPLICEDLARTDEVIDFLRRVGPSLVVTVLLDGPQLATRWPSRYATVLAEEPGSAVLTLTSFGMTARSRPPGCSLSRAVALYADTQGVHTIALGKGADAILLTTSVETSERWTADGRRHDDVTRLVFKTAYDLHAGQP